MIFDNKLKPGDIVELTQEDGNRLILIVHPDGIVIKADNVGTKLKIKKDSDFAVKAIAIDRE